MLENIDRKIEYLKSSHSSDCKISYNYANNLEIPKKKLILFSAHDTTIAAMLKSLSILEKDHDWEIAPSYASSVMMELYSYPNGTESEIKLVWQNETSQLIHANIGRRANVSSLLINGSATHLLSAFKEAVKHNLPDDWI